MKVTKTLAITLVCIILGIMLAWQYKSINYNQAMNSLQGKRMSELMDDLIKLQKQRTELQDRLKELEKENQIYETKTEGDSAALQQIKDNLQKARIFAGLIDVKGKGIIITLDNNEFLTALSDADILNIVNELRASGAQAISVNDERIVAMSEIRQAGNYIMVNGQQITPPYTIKAISDPSNLERSMRLLGGVLEPLEEYQYKVELKQADEIIIRKFVDDGTVIKYDRLTPVN